MTGTRCFFVLMIGVLISFGTIAQAGNAPMHGNISDRRWIAISSAKHEFGNNPILQGTGSTAINPGTTDYFFGLTTLFDISECRRVEVDHADGGPFDPNNTGKLVVHGIDVSVVFFDEAATPLASFYLGSLVPNAPLYSAGYLVTSQQRVDFSLQDLPEGTAKVAIIVEGDATNTDTKVETVDTVVNGIIDAFCKDD
jgi:hypothetical protein